MVALKYVVDLPIVSKRECFVFKVDFKKATIQLVGHFLEYMLVMFGFNERWMLWIRVCFLGQSLVVG